MRTAFRKVFALTALAAALGYTVTAGAQQPAGARTLKMQSTWPASLTLQDNFKMFAERVDKLTCGQLKIDAMAAGQIVPAFEILDATHKKVIDGGHGVSYYWVGKAQGGDAVLLHAGGPLRHGPDRLHGLAVRGRRPRPLVGFLPEGAQAQRARRSRSCPPARRPSAGSSGRSRTSPTSRA